MAVIYSKLGGCLGDTTKLGPLARSRPLCWCQRFSGKVNDPLRVGVFWGRPLREPIREVRCGIWHPGCQHCLPGRQCCCPGKPGGPFAWLECLGFWPAWPSNLTACLTCLGRVSPAGGRRIPAWEEFSPAGEGESACLGGCLGSCCHYFLPQGKESTWLGNDLGGLGSLTACLR